MDLLITIFKNLAIENALMDIILIALINVKSAVHKIVLYVQLMIS